MDIAVRLEALADRVEQLDGPDREVDAKIAKVIGLKHGPDSGFCNDENGDQWHVAECAANFTASLDAAMTLVPDGWGFGIFPECAQLTYGPLPSLRVILAKAQTPALALTAAALRARAALQETDDG